MRIYTRAAVMVFFVSISANAQFNFNPSPSEDLRAIREMMEENESRRRKAEHIERMERWNKIDNSVVECLNKADEHIKMYEQITKRKLDEAEFERMALIKARQCCLYSGCAGALK